MVLNAATRWPDQGGSSILYIDNQQGGTIRIHQELNMKRGKSKLLSTQYIKMQDKWRKDLIELNKMDPMASSMQASTSDNIFSKKGCS